MKHVAIIKELISSNTANWSAENVRFSIFYNEDSLTDIPLSAAKEISKRLLSLLDEQGGAS